MGKKTSTITSFFQPLKKSPPKQCASSSASSSAGEKRAQSSQSVNEFLTNKKQKMSETKEVGELLSLLTSEEWKNALKKHITSQSFSKLAKFVSEERKEKQIFPPPADTFTALNLVPLSSIKVVIVGQDPYHGVNQGHGLAFSVRKQVAIPPSLRNIYKELLDEELLQSMPRHGYLEKWANQGVLLLNSVLTVEHGKANSHAKKGWEEFTDAVIQVLDKHHREKGLVFLLWGKPASMKAQKLIKSSHHEVICTSHPSPLGASKTASPFLKSNCFKRANEALQRRGYDVIDWNVD